MLGYCLIYLSPMSRAHNVHSHDHDQAVIVIRHLIFYFSQHFINLFSILTCKYSIVKIILSYLLII